MFKCFQKLRYAVLLLCPLAAGLGTAGLADAAPAAERPVILVFGDSLSAGYGIRAKDAWPALLTERLAKERRDYTVVNLSISGETTAGGRSRLPAALEHHRPAIVLLALGANDGLRGLPVTQIRDNLNTMIDLTRKAGARTLLVGMRMPPNYGAYAEEFQRIFSAVATAQKIPLAPFLLDGIAGDPQWFQPDGLHPTSAAQGRLLDNVWPRLALLLATPGN